MAFDIYLQAKGQKSGAIKGSSTFKSQEDAVQVMSLGWEVVSPRDPQSGMPTGQRMHKGLWFRKPVDKASPLFASILCTNENITTATFTFLRADISKSVGTGAGTMKAFYSIKLTNANVASLAMSTAERDHAAATASNPTELVLLTYQKIEWTWAEGGIAAEDDWEAKK